MDDKKKGKNLRIITLLREIFSVEYARIQYTGDVLAFKRCMRP